MDAEIVAGDPTRVAPRFSSAKMPDGCARSSRAEGLSSSFEPVARALLNF